MKQPKLVMKQQTPCRWQITTEKGIVLKDDIMLGTFLEAEDYVKRYVSSFSNFIYEMKPIADKERV